MSERIKTIRSCGCILCDIGLEPNLTAEGWWIHSNDSSPGTASPCTHPDRADHWYSRAMAAELSCGDETLRAKPQTMKRLKLKKPPSPPLKSFDDIRECR